MVRSLTQRIQSRFNVSVAEVDHLDAWQVASIGFVCVSNSPSHADEILQRVTRFAEENLSAGFLADVETELIHMG